MSGKPDTEKVQRVLSLLAAVESWDAEVEQLSGQIERDSRRVDSLKMKRNEAWDDYCRLMREMDLDNEGNAGFPKRAAWFLAEMRRQITEGDTR